MAKMKMFADSGSLGPYDTLKKPGPRHKYVVVGDRVEECREVVVHQFSMGDVEDPDLYAAQPLIEWEKSEKGQWVMENAVETPSWHRMPDIVSYGYKYQIRARLMGPRLTEYFLKWDR